MDDPVVISFSELGPMRMSDIPAEGLDIRDVPRPGACFDLNVQARNHRALLPKDAYVFADVRFRVPLANGPAFRHRLTLAFPASTPDAMPRPIAPVYRTHSFEDPDYDSFHADIDVLLDASADSSVLVTDVLAPLIGSLRRLHEGTPTVFVCHASEDKPAARLVASALRSAGAAVWLDEWEIRVGESIVERVSAGLAGSSHLVVLLSETSVARPWVRRELSSALMAQLATARIALLPVRLDGCSPPALIADLKYADARLGLNHAIAQLRDAIFA